MSIVPVLVANLTFASTQGSLLTMAMLASGYIALYVRMVRHAWVVSIFNLNKK
jgi:hypothetical protein